MKFIIDRASNWRDTEPCKEAVKEVVTFTDTRNWESFEEYAKHCNDNFLVEGFDHKVVDGHIERKINREVYVIEFNTLEELMSFINKYGNIVIYKHSDDCELNQITIYDSWIE